MTQREIFPCLHDRCLLACLLLASCARGIAQPPPTGQSGQSVSQILDASLAHGADIGAKVNALVKGCAGASCRIMIPAGSYRYSTPIVLATNVELYGAGAKLTILEFRGAPDTTSITVGNSTINVKLHDFKVEGTKEVVGNGSSYNKTFGISVSGSNNLIDKVQVAHFWGYGGGITIRGSHNTVTNSDVQYATFCINLGGDHLIIKNNYVSNHYSTASSSERPAVHYWDGIAAEGLNDSRIEGNTVEDNAQSGIYQGGNGSLSQRNEIIGNIVRRNWNRGLDNGVTGDVSPVNGISFLTVTNNHVVDNLEDNIWLICVQHATVTGNYSEYTSDYPKFFGTHTANTRSGIAVGDLCGKGAQSNVDYVTVSGNTVIDYQKTAMIGLNFNVRVTSIGNKFTGNSNNAGFYVAPSVELKKNVVQK